MICLSTFPEISITLPLTQVSNNIHSSPPIHEKRVWILQFSLLMYGEPTQICGIVFRSTTIQMREKIAIFFPPHLPSPVLNNRMQNINLWRRYL
jgi:hypothetical protein